MRAFRPGPGAFALALAGVCAARVASAQQPPPLPPPSPPATITLPAALAYARAHQPAIRAALTRVAAQRAQANVPRGQWLPQVGATAQIFGATANQTTASYLTLPSVDIPRIGGTSATSAANADIKPYASTFLGASITQEIFDFGRIAAQAAAEDALVDVRKKDADVERLDAELSVEEAFFAVLAAKAVLAASEGAYARARSHRDLARAGVTSGLRSPIELTRAEADLQRFDIGRARARGGVTRAQAVLAASVGSTELLLDAAGPAPTPAEMPALGDAIRLALQREPHLAAAFARLKVQEQRSRAVAAELRPELLGTGTISGRAGGATPSTASGKADAAGLLPSVPNWDVGLVLSWPLFDGVIDARRSASAAEEEVRREEINVARQALVASVERAYVAVNVAREVLPGLERAVDAAIANETQAEARFGAGLGTGVEMADAEALRIGTEIELAIGRFELSRARAAFGRAIAEEP